MVARPDGNGALETEIARLMVGVLALQGAFVEHIARITQLGAQAVEVRKPEQLAGMDGLIIPGGESTTIGLVAQRWGLAGPLRRWVRAGRPTWGTCAGLILLAERVEGLKQGGQPLIGGLDVTVNRNFFGRQVNSFQVQLDAPILGEEPVEAVFIRAPAITAVGPGVEVLARLPDDPSAIVAVRQGALMATAFHPELTPDTRWHALFLDMVQKFGRMNHHSAANEEGQAEV